MVASLTLSAGSAYSTPSNVLCRVPSIPRALACKASSCLERHSMDRSGSCISKVFVPFLGFLCHLAGISCQLDSPEAHHAGQDKLHSNDTIAMQALCVPYLRAIKSSWQNSLPGQSQCCNASNVLPICCKLSGCSWDERDRCLAAISGCCAGVS